MEMLIGLQVFLEPLYGSLFDLVPLLITSFCIILRTFFNVCCLLTSKKLFFSDQKPSDQLKSLLLTLEDRLLQHIMELLLGIQVHLKPLYGSLFDLIPVVITSFCIVLLIILMCVAYLPPKNPFFFRSKTQ